MKSPKDILALGQVIVRQLELAKRGEVLPRWLAHHLAEVMAEADSSVGTSKETAEARAVELILKLWSWRRALPEPADPLGGYRNAIKVLGQLMPDANPWKRLYRTDNENLLQNMFEILSKSVVLGLLLTQVSCTRTIAEAESKGLEEEEKYLLSALEHWKQFVPPSLPEPKVRITFGDPEPAADLEIDQKPDESDDSSNEDEAPDEQTALHAAILANLERMQTDLNKLLTRWRDKAPHEPETDEVPAEQ